jgi:hypothetical protein
MKVHFFDDDRALADQTWEVPADADDPRAWALGRAAAFVERRLGLVRPVPVTVRDSEGEWDIVLLNGGAAIDATVAESPGVARGGRGPDAPRAPAPVLGRNRPGQQPGRDAQPRHRGRSARDPRTAQGQDRGIG